MLYLPRKAVLANDRSRRGRRCQHTARDSPSGATANGAWLRPPRTRRRDERIAAFNN